MLPGVCADLADGRAPELRRDAGIFPADLALGPPPADALGDGDRAARLAAARMGPESGRSVLAVARPERIDREPAGVAGKRSFRIRARDRHLGPISASGYAAGVPDGRASDSACGGEDGVRGP